MFPNRGLPGGLAEAARLTRAGRVLEATALIQRALQPRPAGDASAGGSARGRGATAGDTIDVEARDVTGHPDRALGQPGAANESASARVGPGSPACTWRARDQTADVPPARTTRDDAPTGQFVEGSYANQAGARRYKLYVPASHAGQPLPLVVMLHGCTQTPDDFANGTGMNALAEEHRCFVLYPEQAAAANRSRCWNWFKRGDQQRDHGEPAIIAGMTREIMRRSKIDPTRVYIAGLSAGGAMAAVMGAAYPELYAAVGIHSGLACASAHDVPSAFAAMRGTPAPMPGRSRDPGPMSIPLPTIVFHGDCDKTVHPRNGEQVVAQAVQQRRATGTTASAEHGRVAGGHSYTRTVHRDSTGRVVVEHWLVHGGGHAWSGGSARGSYTDPKGPAATREMLRFFAESGAGPLS